MSHEESPNGNGGSRRRVLVWILGGGVIALTALAGAAHQRLSLYLSELFIGVTGCALFLVVWQSKSIGRNPFYLTIAGSSLCVGALALLCGASMNGMPWLPVPPLLFSARIASAAALIDAAALFMALLFLTRTAPRGVPLACTLLIAAASLLPTIAWPIISISPVHGAGAFHGGIPGGFVVCILLAGSLALLIVKRGSFETGLLVLLVASIGSRFLVNAAFLLLPDAPVAISMACQLLIAVSCLLQYQGIAAQSLKETDRLLAATTAALELKRLSGIIPVCMSCKRIQVGEDEWQQMEAYVSAHSRARFTHGICPACAEQVFAEMARDGTG